MREAMRTKKRWLAVSCLAVCLLLVMAGHASVQAEMQLEAGYLNERFFIGLPVETLTCVYQAEHRGWMGAGAIYSIWQCQDSAALFHALPWRYGRAFQDQLFDRVTEQAAPDGQVLPLLEGQKAYYYHVRRKSTGQNPWTAPQRLEYSHKLQAHEIVDTYDKELLLVYAPQITLGNRQTYRNILFMLEQYN